MNKNKSLSIIVYCLAAGLIFFGVYSVFVLEPDERAGQLEEARQVVRNLNMISSDEIDCDDIKSKVQTIDAESFEGKNLIRDALLNTMVKGGCFEFDDYTDDKKLILKIEIQKAFVDCLEDDGCEISLEEKP